MHGGSGIAWLSEPMFVGDYQRADFYLETHGIGESGVSAQGRIQLFGAQEPGENANWKEIPHPTAYVAPSASQTIGVETYVWGDLYPYVRIYFTLSGDRNIYGEFSIDGTLREDFNSVAT